MKVIRLDRSAVYGIVSFDDIFYYTDQLDDDTEETPISLERLGICNSFLFTCCISLMVINLFVSK